MFKIITKNRLLIFLSLLYCNGSFAQEIIVIIDGVQGNRPLTLNDFKGKPPAGGYDGETSSSINYHFKEAKIIGDSIFVSGAVVKVEMYSEKSWIKDGKEVNYLLKHEQGHFDMKQIWGYALKNAFENITLQKDNFKSKLDSIATEINKKYLALDELYDKETDHSKNKAEQEKWNQFFKSNLPDGGVN